MYEKSRFLIETQDLNIYIVLSSWLKWIDGIDGQGSNRAFFEYICADCKR